MEYTNEELRAIGSPVSEGTDLEKTLEDIRMMCENQRCALQRAMWDFQVMLTEECDRRIARAGCNKDMKDRILKKATDALNNKRAEISAELLAVCYHQDKLEEGARNYYES